MRRATKERLLALSGNCFTINLDERRDILNSDARQAAELRRLRAVEKWAKVAMKMELAFHCDGCDEDEEPCYICSLVAALRPARRKP